MNDDTRETPNPLNDNPLDANPAETTPLEEIVEEVQTVNVEPVTSEVPDEPVEPVIEEVAERVAVQTPDPMARPMEKAPAAEPAKPKKKKTGLIIGAIIAAVLAICGGVAAAIILINLNKDDAVAKAIGKIMNGDAPALMAVDGTVTLTSNDDTSPISNVEIALNAQTSTTSPLNSSKATVTANFASGGSTSFEFDEIYATNGNMYFKLSGLTNAMEDYTAALTQALYSGMTGVDCATDENGEMSCDEESEVVVDCESEDGCETTDVVVSDGSDTLDLFSDTLSIIEGVDGEWLRISIDDFSNMVGAGNPTTDGGTNSNCMINVIGDAKNYSNSIAEMYSKNPFIKSTTEGVTLASKSGEPVYKVTIDEEKFTAFFKEFQNSALFNNLAGCVDYDKDDLLEEIVEGINNLPTFYAEVDKDYNFTRLYFVSDLAESEMSVTTDLGFSYPTNINIAEPTEYVDFSDMIQEIFTSMYVLPEIEDAEVVE